MFDDLKKMFIAEVKELLDKMEQDLLQLENNLDDKGIIGEIFRFMHTIKGAAGMYGLEKTVEVAHKFEDLFAKIRDGKIKANQKIITLSMKAKDLIIDFIEAKDEGDVSQTRFNNLINELNEIVKDNSTKDNEQAQEKQESIEEPDIYRGPVTYYIIIDPDNDIEERGINFTGIIEDLSKYKDIIITPFNDPERSAKGKYPVLWEVILSTDDNISNIENIFMFISDEVTIKKLCNCNVFENDFFDEFFRDKIAPLSFGEKRMILLEEFAKKIEEAKNEETDEKAEEKKAETDKGFKEIKSIRVPSEKLDILLNLVSELIINNSQLSVAIESQNWEKTKYLAENIVKLTNSIKENTLSLRLISIGTLFESYQRLVRDLSIQLGKEVVFVTEGSETLIDKSIVEKLYTPLLHIIRNALDHGIEMPEERVKKGKSKKGMIRLVAFHSNMNVIIQVQDDGRGIDPQKIKAKAIEKGLINIADNLTDEQILDLIFTPGFSTSENITSVSGRGVGMDVIRHSIRELRGDVEVDSEVGLGTSITIKLPLTLSIIDTLHVKTANTNFLIPISNIIRSEKIKPAELETHSGQRIVYEDELLPFFDIRSLLNIGGQNAEEENLIIIDLGNQKLGLIFEKIVGEVNAVVKTMGSIFNSMDFFLGASILGDGSIAYILDPYKLSKKYGNIHHFKTL